MGPGSPLRDVRDDERRGLRKGYAFVSACFTTFCMSDGSA
jgi:hypothetical protein